MLVRDTLPIQKTPLPNYGQLAKWCEPILFEKDSVLKVAGDQAKFCYFLIEGTCRFTPDTATPTKYIDYQETSFIADDASLQSGRPSASKLMALENSMLLRIRKSNLKHLKDTLLFDLLLP